VQIAATATQRRRLREPSVALHHYHR
jgi:hypothetical protein